MPRATKEWIGKTDDTPIPPRVKQRVVARANQCCANCRLRVGFGGEVDHTVALINGGENRENNLRFLCANCHKTKTKVDVAIKSRAAKTQRAVGPLKREQSAWSKRYHEAKAKGIDPWRRPKVTP
jgi:5-methylcytosine-specific restriction protein A